MLRRLAFAILAAAALLGASAPAAPLALTVHLVRTSFDLLDSVGIEVVVHNPSGSLRTLQFAQPTEYAIEILRGNDVLWSSLPPTPPPNVTFPPHSHSFGPGPTTLVVYDWNALTSKGRAPLPGKYAVRARLLSGNAPSASVTFSFDAPLPIAGIAKLKRGQEVTVSGRLDPTHRIFTDTSASVKLERGLPYAPVDTPLVIRGYPVDHLDGTRTLAPERWAPFGPPPTAQPAPSAS
ncbi:MAG TPA: hypothetical protein VMH02_03755 [Verrucomicrobiae bacterium]|nr:hypothetical protein [Verrucomicrobiae bacterium]